LNINYIIAFSADNASVNYGIYKSVFQNLKFENELIVKANCNCHVINNCAKFGLLKLPLDIENLVIKIYSHFSVSALRLNQLKSCFEYTDNEYKTLLKHVPTRWLSLFKAIDRLIENLEAVKSYFIGINEDNCPKIISEFVWGQSDNPNGITSYELLLHFSHHYMKVFHDSILRLELKSNNSTHLFDIMNELRVKLKNRFEQKYFGCKITEMLKKISSYEKQQFEKEAIKAYQRAIEYLEERFDFNNSLFKSFTELNLEKPIDFNNILKIISALNIASDKDS
jgi:hypothetical protein